MAKITRTEKKMREIMSKGSQPDFASLNHNDANFNTRYGDAMNWIHLVVDPDKLRGEVERFLRSKDRAEDILRLDAVSVPMLHTLGKIAYCINRGAELSDRSYAYINRELAAVKQVVAPVAEAEQFESLGGGAAARVIEDYKNCYSRIDNVKARVLAGKTTLADVADEVNTIMNAHGTRPGVKRRVIAHFKDSLAEAMADSLIKSWVKPLRAIMKALDKDAVVTAPKAPKTEKVVKAAKTEKAPKSSKSAKASKSKVSKSKKAAKPEKAPKAPKSKPAAEPKKQGEPRVSFASQVREMIADCRAKDISQQDVIKLAMTTLNMKASSARNCVLANWDRI
jgi:hypothetical protein